jgi:pimeloyl-ACP methyl ester carboxylesterase
MRARAARGRPRRFQGARRRRWARFATARAPARSSAGAPAVAGMLAIVLVTALAGCSGGTVPNQPRTTVGPRATAGERGTPTAGTPKLEGGRPCQEASGFTCATLRVPLDRSGQQPGRLALRVAAADNAAAPRGVLLVLTGGPGQPGASLVPRIRSLLAPMLRDYRLVMLDQRGTGNEALRCPALQDAMGTSDLTVPPAGTVEACARTIGPRRRLFSTADTVADLEALRAALGAERLTLDGVSYGSYVAERYALAHPDRVSRLVLDSVVPHDDLDPLQLASMRASARVLRAACRQQGCASDPAEDLAAVVRQRRDGPALLDTLVALSIVDPSFGGVPAALHAARQGRPLQLDRLVAAVRRGQQAPAEALSQGLHASTLCTDMRAPWGDSAAPLAGRAAALQRVISGLSPDQVWPFDRATAAGNGIMQTCLRWPPTPAPAAPPGGGLPPVPVLLLAGDHDLSTPLEWAREEAVHAPRGNLVVVAGAGHSVQSRASSDTARQALQRFLAG